MVLWEALFFEADNIALAYAPIIFLKLSIFKHISSIFKGQKPNAALLLA